MTPVRAAIAALGAGLALGVVVAPAWAEHWVLPAHPTWYWQLQGRPRFEPVQITDVDEGWTNVVVSPAPILKLCQFTYALPEVCVIVNWEPLVLNDAEPCVTELPVGLARTATGLVNDASRSRAAAVAKRIRMVRLSS